MNAPSDYEKRIVAMVDSFTKTVAQGKPGEAFFR